jgi:urea carboxylase-associated protein 1
MAGILLEGREVSDEERESHARAVSAKERTAALARLNRDKPSDVTAAIAKAARVLGPVLEDKVIAPGAFYSGPVLKDEHLRIIDLEGRQAVDFLCYDLHDTKNRYNAGNTLKLNRSIYISKGVKLYSDRADVLMTLVEDTVGFHDTIGGCCSAHSNYRRYGVKNTPNCYDTFVAAIEPYGMDSRDIPANLNFFMYVPVREDGSSEILEGRSVPGDYVDLQAERDVLVAISNCAQIFNPCNGWNPTPVRLIRWRQP